MDAAPDTVNADTDQTVARMARSAREGQRILSQMSGEARARALKSAAAAVREQKAQILAANARDVEAAGARALADALVDRLALSPARIDGLADAIETIAGQPDPLSQKLGTHIRPNGLEIEKRPVPLGVIGIIYESRPNVTTDAAALAFFAGNGVVLRAGSDSLESAVALHAAFRAGLTHEGAPAQAVQLIKTTDRAVVGALLRAQGLIDLIIPRGGRSLVARVQNEARVPVLAHLEGVCHLYLDRDAELEMAKDVIINAKLRRPGICGALECLLIDRKILKIATPILEALAEKGAQLIADEAVRGIFPSAARANEDDWGREYLSPKLAVRVVDGIDGALDYLRSYSSGHTEGILTENAATADRFLAEVDSAIVMVNTSTQFADGGEFGMGAEIGIATGRMHARGPVGARELTSYKYVVKGQGQIRP